MDELTKGGRILKVCKAIEDIREELEDIYCEYFDIIVLRINGEPLDLGKELEQNWQDLKDDDREPLPDWPGYEIL